MKFRNVLLGIAVGLSMAAVTGTTANAATYVQRRNALSRYSGLRVVNNRQTKFVKANPNYGWTNKPGGVGTIKSVSGTKWILKTKYLLPNTHAALNKSSRDLTNPQAAAFAGKYLFVLYAPHQFHGKGFVVRYNRSTLNNLSLAKAQNSLLKPTAGMKVGPMFNVGHGQSLAYNKKQHAIWMWRDRPDMKPTTWSTIQRISMSSLKPNRAIKFHMDNGGANVPAGHDLTFDNAGHAYWWGISNGMVKIYKAKLGAKSIHVTLAKQMLRYRTGTHEQSMGYNSHNGRLYLVSDDSVQTLPARKLNGHGSLKPSDIKYTKFCSHREFESMIFDGGHAFLLSNRDPELLRSTTAY